MDYKIQNLVVTANLNCELNMEYLNFSLPNFNYTKEKFNGGVLKLQDPKCTFLLFRTGKIVCLACKSMDIVYSSMERLVTLLPEFEVFVTNLVIVNVVGSADFGRRVRINDLARDLTDTIYEPEIYPAAIMKKNDSKLLIFHTGKIIITGCKSIQHSFQLFDFIKAIIFEYLNL